MRKTALLCASAFACELALGAGWQVRSARSLGMGGAGVALAEDAGANYWNPAALGTYKESWSGTVDAVAKAGFVGDTFTTMQDIIDIVEAERLLYDLNLISQNIDAGTATEQDVQDLLKTILVDFASFYDAEMGIFADGGGAAAYAQALWGGKLAVSLGYTGYGEAGARVDLLSMALQAGSTALDNFMDVFAGYGGAIDRDGDLLPAELTFAGELEATMVAGGIAAADADLFSDELVYQSVQAGVDVLDAEVQDMLRRIVDATINDTGEFVENGTGMSFEGLTVQETRLAFGYPVLGNKLSAGITFNIMAGKTYKSFIGYEDIQDIGGFDDVVSKVFAEENTRESMRLGLDVGLLCRPFEMLSVGIVGHNVLPVEFDQAGGGGFVLQPQWRMGVAVRPLKDLLIAADLDLTTYPSEAIEDYKTQTYAAGVEYYFIPKVAAFRAGLAGDFLNQQEDLTWAFGLGLKLGRILRLDVGLTAEGDLSGIEDAFAAPENIGDLELPHSVAAAVSFALNVRF